MKRINKLFVALFCLLTIINVFAQSALVTWPLTSNQSPNTPTGNIQASPQTIGAGSGSYLLSVFNPYVANGQRLWTGNQGTGWIAGLPDYTRYIQFDAAPTQGNNFTVQFISFNYSDNPLPTNFNILKGEVWYAINNDWSNKVQLNTTPLSYLNTTVQTFTKSLNILVQNGQTFSIRIYPYAPNGGLAMTPSFATHKNVIIEGTTSPDIPANCITNKLNISTGWNHNTGTKYFANNPATDQDVFWKLISAPTNNGSVNLNGPAWVIFKNNAWSSQVGSEWISAFSSAGANQANIDTNLPAYVFQHSVCVTDTSDLTFDLSVLVDNRLEIKFVDSNGNLIASLGSLNNTINSNFTTPTLFVNTVNNVLPGTYYLRLELRNDNSGSSMGVNVQGTVIVTNSSLLGALCCNPPGSTITGSKFNDLDNDGVKDANEPTLQGWIITLSGNGVTLTSTTDSNGNYLFTNLQPGTYTLTETSQSGWIAGPTGSQKTVTVGTNTALNNINFGNRQIPIVGSICGMKFNDLNGNGIKDAGESGISNWEIKLTGAAAKTDTTDSSGNYCFNNLTAGTYTVSETNKTNWQQTYPALPGTHSITLTAGQNLTNIDFGNKLTTSTGCVTPPAGMVGWWPMDENLGATMVTDIIGTNNGTPFPGAIGQLGSTIAGATPGNTLQFLNPQAKVGGSLYYYSSAVVKYVKVPNSPTLNFGTGDLTIDAWVYPVVVNSFPVTSIVYKMETTTTNCIGYTLYIRGGLLHFIIMDGTNISTVTTPITYSQWQHVAAVRKVAPSNTLQLYINGVLAATSASQVNSITNSSDLVIGGIPETSGGTSCGVTTPYGRGEIAIDELEIFNRALTESEIFSIWHANTYGKCKPLTDINERKSLPDKFGLMQNYPNPFNPSTRIDYQIPYSSHVKLLVYDLLGNLIETLVDGNKNAGYHSYYWEAGGLTSGIYFYRMVTNEFSFTRKLLLIK